jgi:hypothetical protein
MRKFKEDVTRRNFSCSGMEKTFHEMTVHEMQQLELCYRIGLL